MAKTNRDIFLQICGLVGADLFLTAGLWVSQLSGSDLTLMFLIPLGLVDYPGLILSLLKGEGGSNSGGEVETSYISCTQAQN